MWNVLVFFTYYFLEILQKLKLAENKEVLHFRLILTPGIDIVGKNTSEMVYLKKIEKKLKNLFQPFLTKNVHFRRKYADNRRLKMVESWN